MRAYRCVIELSATKNGIVSSKNLVIWIVRADSEEDAGRRITRHFREAGIIRKYVLISSISFTEIHLHGDMDLEEYVESQEDPNIGVLF